MKCKNCNLEEVLNKREAEKRWKKFSFFTRRLVEIKIIGTILFALSVLMPDFFWFITIAKNELNEIMAFLNACFIFASTCHIVYRTSKDIIATTNDYRKQKFAKKFPDDAKYLE